MCRGLSYANASTRCWMNFNMCCRLISNLCWAHCKHACLSSCRDTRRTLNVSSRTGLCVSRSCMQFINSKNSRTTDTKCTSWMSLVRRLYKYIYTHTAPKNNNNNWSHRIVGQHAEALIAVTNGSNEIDGHSMKQPMSDRICSLNSGPLSKNCMLHILAKFWEFHERSWALVFHFCWHIISIVTSPNHRHYHDHLNCSQLYTKHISLATHYRCHPLQFQLCN